VTAEASVGSGEAPGFKTGVIWAVLSVLLVLGTAASAFFVWALLGLLAGPAYLFDGIVLVAAAFAAVYVLLLIAGILYRIDRLRGVPHRRVELFE
jgi:hypothetical protein